MTCFAFFNCFELVFCLCFLLVISFTCYFRDVNHWLNLKILLGNMWGKYKFINCIENYCTSVFYEGGGVREFFDCEQVGDCCLTWNEQYFSHIMVRSGYISTRWCLFCTRPTHFVGFYSAASLKQQSAGRYAAPIGHIILILSQPIFVLTP
jgi:hypothetical protein